MSVLKESRKLRRWVWITISGYSKTYLSFTCFGAAPPLVGLPACGTGQPWRYPSRWITVRSQGRHEYGIVLSASSFGTRQGQRATRSTSKKTRCMHTNFPLRLHASIHAWILAWCRLSLIRCMYTFSFRRSCWHLARNFPNAAQSCRDCELNNAVNEIWLVAPEWQIWHVRAVSSVHKSWRKRPWNNGNENYTEIHFRGLYHWCQARVLGNQKNIIKANHFSTCGEITKMYKSEKGL